MADKISEELRIFRKRLRLTQSDLAKRIGANRAQYANWEVGTAAPPLEFRQKLKEIGFLPGGEVADPTVFEIRASRRQVRLLIDVLADSTIADTIRSSACAELLRVCGLENCP